jgi:SHS2 domain-containing protein
MPDKIKFLDHTGDTGLQIRGNSLVDVFVSSAKGMFSIITESENIKSVKEYSISLQADSKSDLLVIG